MNIDVIVRGPVGCGKSAIYFEIATALKAIGVPVTHVDPDAVRSEMNMGGASPDYLEMYAPTVTLHEVIASPAQPVDETERLPEKCDHAGGKSFLMPGGMEVKCGSCGATAPSPFLKGSADTKPARPMGDR